MTQDQALRHGVALRTDADLQRSAVSHESCDMKPCRVFGEADGLFRGGE